MKTTQCFAFALALLICAPALADTYAYRSIGAQGEVSLNRGAGGRRGSQAQQPATGHGSVHGAVSSTR